MKVHIELEANDRLSDLEKIIINSDKAAPPSSPSALVDHIRMGTPLPEDDAMDAPVSKKQSDVKKYWDAEDEFTRARQPSRWNPLGLSIKEIMADHEEQRKTQARALDMAHERERYLEQANEELHKKLNHITDVYDDLKERRDRACNMLRK